MSAGAERMYQLRIPAGYDGKTPLPVVLGLHALTDSHVFASEQVGFDDMATRYNFIGVAPSGLLGDGSPFWFAVPTRDNHDVEFIDDLLDRIEAELCVDRTRVYATGFSNGAQMSSVLACRLPHRIAAVAPIAGVEFSDACDEGPVAVLAFHGTDDEIVSYDGNGLNSTPIAGALYWDGDVPDGLPEHRGVDAAMEAWAQHNACDPEPAEERVAGNLRRRTWQHCRAETVLYVIDGGDHGRPEAAPGTSGVDATRLIFEFFLG